jgi:hypothetical protein
MEDQVTEAIQLGHKMAGDFRDQLDRMREFRDKMRMAGAAPRPEQFTVRTVDPIEPRRSIAIHK